MGKFIDLKEKIFDKLTVLELNHIDKRHRKFWKCICDCGNIKIVRGDSLVGGNTKSCGCFGVRQRRESRIKHGMGNTKIYKIWHSMIDRCNNPKSTNYKNYGGRGIKVCKRWLKFENFYQDVRDPPKGLTLDRTNNDKGYAPKNWRWATKREQSRNRRTNRLIEFNNKIQCLIDWSIELDIKFNVLQKRLLSGWTIKKTFTTPVKIYKKR